VRATPSRRSSTLYRFTGLKTGRSTDRAGRFGSAGDRAVRKDVEAGVREGAASRGRAPTRDLGNPPANIARRATWRGRRASWRHRKIEVQVLDAAQMRSPA
jgi:hypothetical protein